jgi:chitin disaccharide deacetylase
MPISIDHSIEHHDLGTSTSAKRIICVALDDFGLHAGVNEACLNLALAKRVSAVGCMVGAPAWRGGSELLKQIELPQLDVGLHLDFTEHPLRTNFRSSLMMLIGRCYTGSIKSSVIRDEICAQLDAFENAMNRQPVYVDGHQHIHQLPRISNVLLDELSKRYRENSVWLRSTLYTTPKVRSDCFSLVESVKPRVIFQLGGPQFTKRLSNDGFKSNGRLLGVYDFTDSKARYSTLMQYWLQVAKTGDVLMCHASAIVNPFDGIGDARLAEYSYLNSDAFENELDLHNCSVARLSSI